MPTPVPTLERTLIVNAQFPVNARTYKWFEFTVGSDTRVTGGFRAYGGANDIDTILVDEANRTFYQSGYTSRGKVNVVVPAGNYRLIFDNRKAWLTDKSVAAEFYYQKP